MIPDSLLNLKVPARYMGSIWHFLTKPPDAIRKPEVRRRARLLSALLLVLIPLAGLGIVASDISSNTGNPFLFANFRIAVAVVFSMTIGYLLSRTIHYIWAAALTLGTQVAATLLIYPDEPALAIYLSLSILLSSMLLPVLGTVLLGIVGTVGLVLVTVVVQQITVEPIKFLDLLTFNIIMFALITVGATIRRQDLRQIERQSEKLLKHTEELRRARDHVEAILDSVGDGVLVISSEGHIEQVNQAFERQTGYKAHEVEQRDYRSLEMGDLAPGHLVTEVTTAIDAIQPWHGEVPIRRKDGTAFDAALTIAPMQNPDSNAVSFVASLRDISAQKEVDRMKDSFVSSVSHELRTPVTSIKLNLKMIGRNPDKQPVYMDLLEREIDRLSHIIEDLLQLSRLDQEGLSLNMAPTNLNLLAKEYVSDRTPLFDSHRISLSHKLSSDLPDIDADKGLLGQVLSILLTNANNYTPSGGHVVVRTGVREDRDRVWAGLSVSDDGPGIPDEEQLLLFRRFYRGKLGRESGNPGTGLGLAIASQIVEQHNGYIEVASEGISGKGTTFTVWLQAQNLAVN